jgi:hypothetical protein
LADKGWEVVLNPDGSMSAAVPESQASQFTDDQEECMSMLDDLPRPEMTETLAKLIWSDMLDAADCVAALNSDWTPSEPPSEAAAIEALQKSPIDLGGWEPHMNVPPEQHDYSYTECPVPPI